MKFYGLNVFNNILYKCFVNLLPRKNLIIKISVVIKIEWIPAILIFEFNNTKGTLTSTSNKIN